MRKAPLRRAIDWRGHRIVPSRFPTVGPWDRIADPADFEALAEVEALTNRVEAWSEAIAPHLTRAEARGLRHEAVDLCERIRQRVLYVRRQLAASASKPTKEP